MHILEGTVSENMCKPFNQYAYKLYAERNEIKKKMKVPAKSMEDLFEWT